jgi:hypothetical protein
VQEDQILKKSYQFVLCVKKMQEDYIKNLQSSNQELKMRLQNLELTQHLGTLPMAGLGMGMVGGGPLAEIIQR